MLAFTRNDIVIVLLIVRFNYLRIRILWFSHFRSVCFLLVVSAFQNISGSGPDITTTK
jgi:hypothetical protein